MEWEDLIRITHLRPSLDTHFGPRSWQDEISERRSDFEVPGLNDMCPRTDAVKDELFNELSNLIELQASRGQAYRYFRHAFFLLEILALDDQEFDAVCRMARECASAGCSFLGEKTSGFPAGTGPAGILEGLKKDADSVNTMRYISEAEAELRRFRERFGSK